MPPATTMESALLKPRSESPRNTNLRVHFKQPIEEDAMSSPDTLDIHEMSRRDPMIKLHAKEIIAAKLIEGYTLTGNGEKCPCCHMPLMVKEDAWEGVFCGQNWCQTQKTGVCVICPENEDDDESNASSQDVKEYEHRIPSFPEDDASQDVEEDYSRDDSLDHGSVGEFKKKFAISSDVHIKKIEMNTEVDEICAKELKQAAAASQDESKNCPSCGMEMLDFGEDLECPFCALEIIKEELGIAGVDISGEDSSGDKTKSKKLKKCALDVEGMHLRELATASSSCSTLSASVKFGENASVNLQTGQDSAISLSELEPIVKAPSSGSAQLAISAILKKLRDEDGDKMSPAPEKSAEDEIKDDDAANKGETDSEAGPAHMAVNTVLKRLITGFWMENNEKTETGHAKHKTTSLDTDDVEEQQPVNDDVSMDGSDGKRLEEVNLVSDERDIPSGEAYINGIDDLQDRVKAFAAIVFGSKGDKTEMFKSNEIEVSSDDVQKEDSDSLNAGQNWDEGSPAANIQDEDAASTFSSVESTLFDEDMGTEEIFATLDEIEAVTKNILDLPVFSQERQLDADIEATSREDEETSYRDEEEVRRSSIDPPSVCSRDSRDPPNPTENSYEPLDENLLLSRKKNGTTSSPDTRDPPTTISDLHPPKLELSVLDSQSSAFDRLPRDPSEHGGSLELDSFSQEDDENLSQTRQTEEVHQLVAENEDHVTSRNQSLQSDIATFREPPEHVVSSSAIHRIPLQNNATTASRPAISRPSKLHSSPINQKSPVRNKAEVSMRKPMEPESSPVPSKSNKITSLQAKDLYQRPDILTKIANEPESSRDAIVRHRLMQLNSRFQKLTSQSDSSYTAVDAELKARYQKLTEPPTDASHSQLSTPVDDSESNTQSVFREQRFTFDTVDLHQATSTSGVSSFGIKGTGNGLSPSAAARHEHYKKQLYATEKKRLHSEYSNDSGPCLSPSAAQRRQHYKEFLREQLARGPQIVSQE